MAGSDRWLYGWGLGYAAVGGASLLVPLYAIELGGGAFIVGLIAASAALAGVPGALLWGRLAARTRRRRPFVLVALGATAVTLAVVPLLASPWTVLLANASLWFVVAAAAPVLNLVVIEGVPERRWEGRIGLLNTFQGVGWVCGLLLGTIWTGAVVTRLGPRSALRLLFPVLAILAALALAVTRVWYPERPTTDPDRFRRAFRRFGGRLGAGRYLRTVPFGPSRLYWTLASARRNRLRAATDRFGSPLRRYLLASSLFSTGFAVFWGPMPAYLTVAGVPTDRVFVLFLLANLGSAVCYPITDDLSARLTAGRLQRGALAARAVLFPAVPFLGRRGGVGPLGLGFALVGATWAFIAVTATGVVGRLSDADVRADALGTYAAIAGLGTGVGSALGGGLAGVAGYTLTFAIGGALVLAGLALVRHEGP